MAYSAIIRAHFDKQETDLIMKPSHETSFADVNPFSAVERSPRPVSLPEDMSDITDPAVQREMILAQDKRILDAVSALATKIKSCPTDPAHPDLEPRLLIVGGFGRDSLLGKHPKDADVEVYGISVDRLEALLEQLFGDRVSKVGKSFCVFKVLLGDGLDFDVSIPRRESSTGPGTGDFEVTGDPSMTVEEAARRRDFTMNALMVDPLTGGYVDPYGGIADLQNKVLRVTNEQTFQEDPLRVYRAVQFSARMGLRCEARSLELMQEMVEDGALDYLKTERVTVELEKLFLKSKTPSVGLRLMKELGIIDTYYPELYDEKTWERLLQAVDDAGMIIHQPGRVLTENERLQVMLGAFCSSCRSPKDVQEFFKKITFAKKEVMNLAELLIKEIREPMRIWKALQSGELSRRLAANEVRKAMKRIHPASPEALVALSEAMEGRSVQSVEDEETYPPALLFRELVLEHPEWLDPKKDSLIDGEELQRLGIPPGKDMGKIIKAINAARDTGDIQTHDEAVDWLRAKGLLSESLV